MTDTGLGSVLSFGPFGIPLWALLFFGGYLAGMVALRLAVAGDRNIRRIVSDRVFTALLIAFAVWKLAPIVTYPRIVFSRPLYLLYASGGFGAVIVGILAALSYLALSTRRWWQGEDVRIKARGLIACIAGIALVFGLGAATVSLVDRGGASDAMAPDFALTGIDGEIVSLSDYRGRTVIMNFWATWCPPCRAEIPVLVDFHRGLETGDVVLLGINQTASENSLDSLQSFVSEHGIDFPVLLDGDNSVFIDYGVRGIPTTFVVGPIGTIVGRRIGVVTKAWLGSFVRR